MGIRMMTLRSMNSISCTPSCLTNAESSISAECVTTNDPSYLAGSKTSARLSPLVVPS